MPSIDLLDDFDMNTRFFKPKMIDPSVTIECLRDLPVLVKQAAKSLFANGWKFYFVNQIRGKCYVSAKVITLPSWAMKKPDVSFRAWYVAHECAHAMIPIEITRLRPHGIEFMEQLKLICPSDCIIHELGYKPRNAAAAGIGEKNRIYTFDDL